MTATTPKSGYRFGYSTHRQTYFSFTTLREPHYLIRRTPTRFSTPLPIQANPNSLLNPITYTGEPELALSRSPQTRSQPLQHPTHRIGPTLHLLLQIRKIDSYILK